MNKRQVHFLLASIFIASSIPSWAQPTVGDKAAPPPAVPTTQATQRPLDADVAKLPTKRPIACKDITPDNSITITAVWQGKKDKYTGVPLRSFFKEMTSIPIETMANWKELSRYELIMEAVGKDGYPGIISATELAMNKTGDKFVLFTKHDEQTGTDTVNLVCKGDEYRVRWVRDIAYLRVVAIPREPNDLAATPATPGKVLQAKTLVQRTVPSHI